MKATIKNLKENREAVIETLIDLFGDEVLKSKMRCLLNLVEEAEGFSPSKTIEECINELDMLSCESSRKVSKTGELIGNLQMMRYLRSDDVIMKNIY